MKSPMLKSASVAILLSLFTLSASAQQHKARKVKERPTAEKIAEMRTDKMDQRLELSDAQESKIYNLTLHYTQAVENNKPTKAEGKSKRPDRELMKANMEKKAEAKKAYDLEVMNILNNEQKVEYAYMLKAESKSKMGPRTKQGAQKRQHLGKNCKGCPNAKGTKQAK